MATTLIRNAQAIVTVDREDRVLRNGNILVEDNIIRYIGPAERAADRVIDASHCFVYPGLVNTHHHLYQTFTRNLPQVQKMELFPWLRTLYEIWRGLDEDCIYNSSLVGLGELLKYGCTTCMDHHYVFPKVGSEHFIDQQFRAADQLGVRFHATRGSMSRGRSDGGLPPDDLVQDVDTILKDSQRLVEKFHDTSRFSMRQVALAPCSPFSVTTDLLKQSAVLAQTGTGIAHCPVSNMKLASGVCRVPDMLALGVPVGLAVDGSASNDCSNLLAEIRAAYLLHRLTYSAKAPTGYDLLKMATMGSARLLGRQDEIGSLEMGKAADLFLLNVDLLELAGAKLDPACLLGTVGYARPAELVMVNGRVVVEHGRVLGMDEERTRVRAEQLVKDMLQKAE